MYIDLFHRLHRNSVERKHKGFNVFGRILQVGCSLDDLCLDAGHMRDFKERVDIVDVDLLELEDLDGRWVAVRRRKLAAREDERKAVIVCEHLIVGTVDGGFFFLVF